MPRFSWAAFGMTTTALSVLLAPMVAFAEPSPTSVHVVQPGDTLSQIALDAGTDTDTIVALNGLTNADVLSVGEALKVPANAATATATSTPASTPTSAPTTASGTSSYSVASGDNLWDIAQRFGTTPDAIAQLNHLGSPDQLSVGTVLSVPPGDAPRAASSGSSGSSGSGTSSSSGTSSGPGAGSTSSASAGSNASASSSATPRAGSSSSSNSASASSAPTLVISSVSSSPSHSVLVSYTVQPGETLTQVAHRFSVTADTIIQATNLSDANKIVVGSVLKIPIPARTHVVTDGETLRDIASSEKVDLGSLIDFNQIGDPSLIRVGQVVLLPGGDAKPAVTASSGGTSSASATPTPAATSAAPSTPSPVSASAAPTASTDTPTQAAASAPAATPTPTASATLAAHSASTAGTPAGSSASNASAATATPGASPSARPGVPSVSVAAPAGAPSSGLAAIALKFLGAPYVWGGSSPKGFDCSGFVWYIAKQLNKQVSRGMLGQYSSGSHPSRDALQPGDLVFFQNTWAPGLSHNGVYVGDDEFVNAADESTGVTISNLKTAYWSAHWFGATRLP
jgi:peptidoglycan endopeptidase LytF/peptidoglycan endopeptidase LytE